MESSSNPRLNLYRLGRLTAQLRWYRTQGVFTADGEAVEKVTHLLAAIRSMFRATFTGSPSASFTKQVNRALRDWQRIIGSQVFHEMLTAVHDAISQRFEAVGEIEAEEINEAFSEADHYVPAFADDVRAAILTAACELDDFRQAFLFGECVELGAYPCVCAHQMVMEEPNPERARRKRSLAFRRANGRYRRTISLYREGVAAQHGLGDARGAELRIPRHIRNDRPRLPRRSRHVIRPCVPGTITPTPEWSAEVELFWHGLRLPGEVPKILLALHKWPETDAMSTIVESVHESVEDALTLPVPPQIESLAIFNASEDPPNPCGLNSDPLSDRNTTPDQRVASATIAPTTSGIGVDPPVGESAQTSPREEKGKTPREDAETKVREYLSTHSHATIRVISNALGLPLGSIQKTPAWRDLMVQRRSASRSVRTQNLKTSILEKLAARTDDPSSLIENREILEQYYLAGSSSQNRQIYDDLPTDLKDHALNSFLERTCDELRNSKQVRSDPQLAEWLGRMVKDKNFAVIFAFVDQQKDAESDRRSGKHLREEE